MFRYYAWLAARGLKRNPGLTALMVLAIGIGIGASVTTLTVLQVLSGDPLPGKSDTLFYPQIDPQDSLGYQPGEEPPDVISYLDAKNLLNAGRADRQAVMTGGGAAVIPDKAGIDPYLLDLRYTSADFFAMFEVPFLHGSGWTAADDEARARVVVISRRLNDKLFDGGNSVDRTLRLNNQDFRIVGVIDEWRPNPHFYDLNTGNYSDSEEAFIPLETAIQLEMGRNGTMNCFGDERLSPVQALTSGSCMWLQYWVELDSAEKQKDYLNFLTSYSEEQRRLGRFERPVNVRLRSLMQWLDYQKVVPEDVRLQSWTALGFLVVCIVNTVGLMLAKFLRRSNEVAVRRALGAPRTSIFSQFLLEAGAVGAAGALLGLALSLAGLAAVRMQPVDYAELAHLNGLMFCAAVLMAVVASLVAGLLPAWQACRVPPALQLKSE